MPQLEDDFSVEREHASLNSPTLLQMKRCMDTIGIPAAMIEDVRKGCSILASTSTVLLVHTPPLALAALGRSRLWDVVRYYTLRDVRVV